MEYIVFLVASVCFFLVQGVPVPVPERANTITETNSRKAAYKVQADEIALDMSEAKKNEMILEVHHKENDESMNVEQAKNRVSDAIDYNEHYIKMLKKMAGAGASGRDFWKMKKDDASSHFTDEMKEKEERGEIKPKDVDKFENEYGPYKNRSDVNVIDLVRVINQANDLTDLVEADIKVLSPDYDIDQITRPTPTKGIEVNWAPFGKRDEKNIKGEERRRDKRDARRDREYLWLDKIVPYEIRPELTDSTEMIVKAMKEISTHSCIKFVKRTTQPNWIQFVRKSGCWSSVGKVFWTAGPQEISLGVNCIYKGTIMHEILHSLGFWHEQSRPDRNQYIEVFWENIDPGELHNFKKYGHTVADVLGATYDYKSIMHYGSTSFSINGKKTLQAMHDPNMILGQREGLSATDKVQLNTLYDCALTQHNKDGWSQWSDFGPCDINCNHKRTRFCTKPNRMDCIGANYWGIDTEMKRCPNEKCYAPVDGHWNKWGAWSACSVSCDSGTHTRRRECTDPPPKNGGKNCVGPAIGSQTCVMKSCSVGPNDCEFDVDSFCKFTHDPTNSKEGNYKWIRRNGKTPSSGTGPEGDHTSGNGYYVFIESSSPARPGYQARLLSPTLNPKAYCLDFYYNMFGISIGRLTVYTENVVTKNRVPVWTMAGDQGKNWHHAKVDLKPQMTGVGYRVIFEGERGNSYQGDAALDDIYFRDGSCDSPGSDSSIKPTTAPPPSPSPSVLKIDCFNDFGFVAGKRPFSFSKDMREMINWQDNKSFDKLIADCSAIARNNGWQYFAIQFFGECWSGDTSTINYGRDGASTNCYIDKVGKQSTMMVYKWVNL